jgi:hypothetical protein
LLVLVKLSKGYDFIDVIDNNQGIQVFVSYSIHAIEIKRFKELRPAKQNCKVADHFDVVAIIRGGGDVGLSCHNYDLAKEIALFPHPSNYWYWSCYK